MELKEERYQECNEAVEYVAELNQQGAQEQLLVSLGLGQVECIDLPLYAHRKVIHHGDGDEVGGDEDVDEQEEEELAIPEADAIIYPGTVVVHVEYAPAAGGAVVTPLWLEDVAHQTVATSLVFCVAQVEAPKHWHLPRVGSHDLEERPHQHAEQQMEEHQYHSRIHVSYINQLTSASS